MAYSAWQASNAYALGAVVRPTSQQGTGLVFRCTVAGTSAATEPGWSTQAGNTVVDGTVTWLAVGAILPDLSELYPTSIIDLFELQLNTALHGSNDLYRFHAGLTLKTPNTGVTWNGNQYTRYPIEVEGFEYRGDGQLPRPKIRVSNLFSLLSLVMIEINASNPGNDLCGAKLTRIRTLARYLDAVNFPGDTNPYGTPDPTAEAPREIYYVDRKVTENRDLVEFELVSAFDLAGVRAPKRQCIANVCQWVYKSTECSYVPVTNFTGTYNRKQLNASYSRTGSTITVTSNSHGISVNEIVYLDISSGDAIDAYYTVASVSSNSFTVSSLANTTTSGSCTIFWMRIDATGHGLSASKKIYLNFTSGSATSGGFTVGSTQPNNFTVLISSGSTTNGNLQGTQYYDLNDAPVYSAAQDVCAKRLSSCETRFDPGNDLGVPFGSFPSIGSYIQ